MDALVLDPLREDELVRLVEFLEPGDLLPTALVCRKLRVAVFALHPRLPGAARRLPRPRPAARALKRPRRRRRCRLRRRGCLT